VALIEVEEGHLKGKTFKLLKAPFSVQNDHLTIFKGSRNQQEVASRTSSYGNPSAVVYYRVIQRSICDKHS
jgi:hypothetical protein